jgi:RHS repeat-associated protein
MAGLISYLNEQQLIHMNGRVYDYNLGRFMSVDPLIQSPTSTQSINPYSYIMNNPLAGTDPTGYAAVGPRDEQTAIQCDLGLQSKGCGTQVINGDTGREITSSNGSSSSQDSSSKKTEQDVSKVGSAEQQSRIYDEFSFEIEDTLLHQADYKPMHLSGKELALREKQLWSKVSIRVGDVSSVDNLDMKGLISEYKDYLKDFISTEQGWTELQFFRNGKVFIELCSSCESISYSPASGSSFVMINVNGDGYSRAGGENAYVALKGNRLVTHEMVHALRRDNSSRHNEMNAVRTTNTILRQMFGAKSGERNAYGKEYWKASLDSGDTLINH